VRAAFDGLNLRYLGHGTELSVKTARGLYEPSLACFGGRFFLTLRNDETAYVTSSPDGLEYEKPIRWTFDDGAEVGSDNTQAHWVTHENGLFLVYTRRADDNGHVLRHRAPLFMAQVEPARLVLVRASERVLVPNHGAQLGNFAVADVNERETWVTTSEAMSRATLPASAPTAGSTPLASSGTSRTEPGTNTEQGRTRRAVFNPLSGAEAQRGRVENKASQYERSPTLKAFEHRPGSSRRHSTSMVFGLTTFSAQAFCSGQETPFGPRRAPDFGRLVATG
jgi:hypothetical protein